MLCSCQRLADGTFEAESVNDKVQKRLTTLAERLRDFTKGEEKTAVSVMSPSVGFKLVLPHGIYLAKFNIFGFLN